MNYSSIQLAYTCLRKYELVTLKKIPSGAKASGDLEFGTALHMGLQAILEGDDWEAPFSLFWNTLKNREVKYGRFNWEQLKNLGEIFLARFARLHAKNFDVVSMEDRLYGDIAGLAVEGTPDFVGLFKSVPSLVDFKTSAAEYPKEKIITNPQLYLYAYLAKTRLNYDVKQIVYIVFIKGQERIQVLTQKLDPAALEDQLETLRLMCADLETRKEFPKNPNACGAGLYRCDYFNQCWPNKEEESDAVI